MWNTPFNFEELILKVSLIEWSILENSIQDAEGFENATTERSNQRTGPIQPGPDQTEGRHDAPPQRGGDSPTWGGLRGEQTCFRSLQRVNLGRTCWTKLKEEGYLFNKKMISTM